MTTTATSSEHQMTAFLGAPDSPDVPNPIHSTEVARAYGFEAALVGGVTVYGWAARTIMDVLGTVWLDDGWADVRFRRPVYPGDEITIRVEATGPGTATLEMLNGIGDGCVVGTVGLGRADWLGGLVEPSHRRPEEALSSLPRLTMDSAPLGEDIRAMRVAYTDDVRDEWLEEKQRDTSPPWTGPGARIHPGWTAARMTPLIHHSFDYGPSIHARSQIQHLAPAIAGQEITVAGHFVEAFERKGHHYAVVDGLMLGEDGTPLAKLRHTTIFEVAQS